MKLTRLKCQPSTWTNTIKNNVDVEIAEKNPVEEAIKTKQNTEDRLTINIWAPIFKNKIPNKFASY